MSARQISVRVRAAGIIILIIFIILLFSIFSGILYVRFHVDKSTETGMLTTAGIADHFINSEITLLKLKTAFVAGILSGAKETLWPGILGRQYAQYPEFLGMAVFDKNKTRIAFAGEQPAPPEIANEDFVISAFSGKTIISSTYPGPDGVVLYTAVPIQDADHLSVLVITIPGIFFSEQISDFTIWETGHIFISDADGYCIADNNREWLQNRFNYINAAATNSEYREFADVVSQMVQGKTGTGRFTVNGVSHICAYMPIIGSDENWSLGVEAPLPERPLQDVDKGLLLVGCIAFVLGCLAAILGSKAIKKPFEEAAELKEIAEANSETKSKFLATMSHEMRTPLNAVIGLSELTLGGNIGGEEKENIQNVYTAGVTLLGIINDILDISKIESGKFELHPVNYDVPSLINDVITLNTIRIEDKPITFKLTIDDKLPARLLGDDLRVKQIFSNLLSNAFKYTKAGVVEWYISTEKNGNDVWLISGIKDSGIGIRAEDMGKLFLNYSQVDTGKNRRIEGTGLGLALTKYMIEMMDGNISVESEYGKGSTFTFRVKQGFVTDTCIDADIVRALKDFKYIDQKQSRNSRLVRIQLPYARVLVVDDVPTNHAVVKGIMKPYGMQVDCISSGREAIDLIRQGTRYNAIFMDHMMPEMDGIEAVRIIRNEIDSEYARTVPIIALTANAVRGNEEMFLHSGFQAFLSKPIDVLKMDAVIRQWVRDKDQEENVSGEINNPDADAGTAAQGSSKGKIDGVDLDAALRQFGGDEETLATVLKFYSENTPAMLEQIRDVSPDTSDNYIIVMHGIKGSSRGIAAARIGDMAEKLEHAGEAKDYAFIRENNEAFIIEVDKLIAAINAWLNFFTTGYIP